MNHKLSCNPISVLVPVIPDTSGSIPDTSGIHRTETLTFCPWPYRTRPEVIPDTSDRFRTEPINSLHVIFLFSFIIYCILASQQINYSTRERSKASYGKHDKSQVKLISHFHYFTNVPICELQNMKQTKWLSYKVQVLVTNGEDEIYDMFIVLSSGQPYKRL